MKKPKIILHQGGTSMPTYTHNGNYCGLTYVPHWYYMTTGHNNKPFTTSETFTRKSDAIRSIKRLCETFGIVDFELIDKPGDK